MKRNLIEFFSLTAVLLALIPATAAASHCRKCFLNSTGTSFGALHITVVGADTILSANVVWPNPPSTCPSHVVTRVGNRVIVDWPSACVQPGQSACLAIRTNAVNPEFEGYWMLAGGDSIPASSYDDCVPMSSRGGQWVLAIALLLVGLAGVRVIRGRRTRQADGI